MTGENLFTHQLSRASDECRPYLMRQFPKLNTPQMASETEQLVERIKSSNRERETKKLLSKWLSEQASKYGEILTVESIPKEAHEIIDPLDEAAIMMGPEKVIVVMHD